MVLAVRIPLKNAANVQKYMHANNLLDKSYTATKTDDALYYVVQKKFKFTKVSFEEKDDDFFKKSSQKISFKELISEHLTKEEVEQVKTGYDIIGTIAILEIDYELRPKENIIAQALLKSNSTIKTVLRKDGEHVGIFRNQKMKFLAGIETKETVHIENGVRLKVNVETVYFSPRLSTERMRIAQQVKKDESILVMFSGAAPYPCVLAKKTQAKKITAIEINPDGHKYAQENIRLNKIKNVELYLGDVKEIVPTLKETFDRILMPLPKTADSFLECALEVAKKGTIIHFYDFLHEDEFKKAEEKIAAACKQKKLKHKILGVHTCGCQGVRMYRICVDFIIL